MLNVDDALFEEGFRLVIASWRGIMNALSTSEFGEAMATKDVS